MSTEQNKMNARRIVEESWNKHNPKLIDELFSNDAILHNPQDPTVVKGPQGAKTSLQTYLTAFPDVKLTIEKEIADGEYVVQHLRAIGANTGPFNGMPATGKKANTTGVMTTKFDNGKITNPHFSRYRVPRFSDMPVLETVLVDRKDLPSAGAGETPIIGLAPAIGNAIFDATGTRLRSMPMARGGLKI